MGYNLIQRALMWVGNIKPKREILHNIEEESIKKDRVIKNLTKKIASQESQLAEYNAIETERKEKKLKKDINNSIAKELKEQEIDIKEEEYGKWFSLNRFFRKIYGIKVSKDGDLKNKDEYEIRSKFGKGFKISDKNDEVSWKFGELLISTKGLLGISDSNGKIRIISSDVNGLIHKPEGIFNQFKMKRFLLARDKEGHYIDGIDNISDRDEFEANVPVPVWNPKTEKYETTTRHIENARRYIIELLDKVRNKDEKIKRIEMAFSELRQENIDKSRTVDILLHSDKLGKSAVTQALETMNSYSMSMAETNMKLSSLQEKNVLLEKKNNSKDNIIDKLIEKLEGVGDMTVREFVKAEMKEMVEFNKSNERVIEKEVIIEKPVIKQQVSQIPKK